MAIARRKEVHLHGDGRTFSLVPLEKRAYLYGKDVLAVIGPVDPTRRYPSKMLDAIAAAMADYLALCLLKRKHPNHGTSLRALDAIARESAKLAARIESLEQDYLLAIEENRFEPFDSRELGVEKFDMLTLCKKLHRLSHAVVRARSTMKEHRRGAPSAEALGVAIGRLLTILEEAKLLVVTTESGSAEIRRKVSGPGGELLLALFRAFDRHTTEAQICGAIKRVRALQGTDV